MLLLVSGEAIHPFLAQGPPTAADSILEAFIDAVGHEKLRIFGPTIRAFCQPDLLCAKGIAVGGCSILLMRCAVADDAVDNDEGGSILGAMKYFDRARKTGGVVGILQLQNVPVISFESCGNVLAHREIGVTLDRHGVAVVDPA